MTYILGRMAKLNWCPGHKSLKLIYEGTSVPVKTYGAPVWEEAIRNTDSPGRCRACKG